MSNYNKLNLSQFKTRLTEGAYATAAGANRAVGKMSDLDDADKAKAKAAVLKHFGTAKPEKVSKKVAKKAGKKVAKKAVAQ